MDDHNIPQAVQNLHDAIRKLTEAAEAADPQTRTVAGVRVSFPNTDRRPMLPLTANTLRHLTNAIEAVTAYAIARPTDFVDLQAQAERLIIADIEDHFDAVDPVSYLDDVMAGPDAEASLAAYEYLVTGELGGGKS